MKSQVRSEILSYLKGITADDKLAQSLELQEYLRQLLKDESGCWGAYQALNTEPQLNWSLVAPHIDWAFPKIENNEIKFYQNVTQFSKSNLGIQEPTQGEFVDSQKLNGVVMPGLAFDLEGYRLGRGAGFYDRSLNQFNNKKVGVCFESSLLKECPREAHDIFCHVVVTNKSIYKIKSSEGVKLWN